MTSASFEELTEPFLSRPGGQRSTMMGLPCVRRDGVFFASFDRQGSLLIKLSQERVIELISQDQGTPFTPNGRRFREWVSVSIELESLCRSLLEEAWQRASKTK
jgi:hypothetical protein